MKKIMKKSLLALALCFSAGALGLGVASCGETDDAGVAGSILSESKVWLDRYEECVLPVKEDVKIENVKVKSSDENLVRYEGGRVVSTGKAEKSETLTLTVEYGGKKEKLEVKVRDSGAEPELVMADPSVYLGVAVDFPATVVYLEQTMPIDLTGFTVEELGNDVLVTYANGKITGNALGETSVLASITYKGLELEGLFDVEVKPASGIEFDVDEIEVYQADSKLANAQINVKLVKAGVKVENPSLTYEVTEGKGLVEVSQSGAVHALKSGKAKIKVTYADDPTVYAEIPVTIHENYKSEYFTTAGLGGKDTDGVDKYDSFTKVSSSEEIGGKRSDEMYKFTLGLVEGSNGIWNHRMLVGDYGKNFVDAYRQGYRYFAYDMYYEDSDDPLHKSSEQHQLYIGSGGGGGLVGAYCEWMAFDSYFHRGYMRVLENQGGEWVETNVLRKDRWIRIVYDMRYYAFNNPDAVIGFFLTSGQTGAKIYLDEIRYYFDGSFLPEETRTFEEKDGYVQATNEELHVHNIDHGAKYEAAGEVAGVTDDGKHAGAYKYQATSSSAWNNQLIVVSSDDYSIGRGMQNMTEYGNYLTFDFYSATAKSLSLTIGHWLYSKNIRLDQTSMENDPYLAVLDMNGNRLYTLPKNQWVTISVAFVDAYAPISGWSRASIFVGIGESGLAYIDNVRYYETNEYIPEDYLGERPVSDFHIATDRETLSWAKESDGAAVQGAAKYTSTMVSAELSANDWWNKGLYFSNVHDDSYHPMGTFYDKGYHYITFDVYLTGNIAKVSYSAWCNDGKGAVAHAGDLVPGQKVSRAVLLKDADGNYVSTWEKDTWYTLTMEVEYLAKPSNWSAVYFRLLKGSGEDAAVAYLKNLRYHNETPAEKPKDPIVLSKHSSSTLTEADGIYTLSSTKDDWQSEIIFGDYNSPIVAAKWIFAEMKFENIKKLRVEDRLGFTGNVENYVDEWTFGTQKTNGQVKFYDANGNAVTTVENGVWYKVALPVKAKTGKWGEFRMWTERLETTSNGVVQLKNLDYGNTNIYA